MISPMNVYRHGSGWWLRFRDPKGTERRLRGAKSKRAADGVARNVSDLLDFAAAGQAPPESAVLWVMGLDDKRREKLEQWGLIQRRHTAAWQGLDQQIEQWEAGMIARGVGEGHAATQRKRVASIAESCGFTRFADIDPERVVATIDRWRRDRKVPGFKRRTDVSEKTLAAYLKAFKAFTRWMTNTGQAARDPMAAVKVVERKAPPTASVSNMAQRRALTEDEQAALVDAAAEGDTVLGMPGPERALLYRLDLETGLRKSAVYRLTVGDVDPDGFLDATGSGARNKRTTPKPLRPALLADLLEHCAGRADDDPLFDLPHQTGLARMVRADAQAAGIDTVGVDFHCLRHTFATSLARSGVQVKVLADLLDDSVKVAMSFYTHTFATDMTQAVNALPDLSPGRARATNRATA